jgi:DHA1 family inner membrane transport protein
MLLAAALGLVAGPVADRYGYRRSLLVGAGAIVASAVGTALAPSFALLLLAALVGALSRAVVQPVSVAIAGSWFVGDARRRAIGLVTAAGAGGAVVGVPLLTAVAAAQGWRAAFLALAALGAGALALAARGLPPDDRTAGPPVRVGAILAAYRPLLRDRPTLGVMAATLLRTTGAWGMGTYVVAYLIEEHGLALPVAGLAFSAAGAGIFVGSLAAGGRLGARPLRPLLVAAALLAGAVVGAAVLLALPPAAVIGLTFLGFGINGVGNVAGTTLLADEARAGRATTMTLNGALVSLGAALGGSVGGALLALGGYHATGLAPLACGALGAALVWWSRP